MTALELGRAIRVEGLTKRYGRTVVVDDVSLELPAGGVVSIIGPNGAGKSTLLSVVARLLDAESGRVLVDGDDVSRTRGGVLAARLGILRQDNHLAVRLTVRELLLDEPLNNLDMKHARAMMRMARDAADGLGKTVVAVLHDINFASCWSDRIVAMRDGRIAAVGTPDDVMRTDVLRQVYDMDVTVREVDGRKVALYYT